MNRASRTWLATNRWQDSPGHTCLPLTTAPPSLAHCRSAPPLGPSRHVSDDEAHPREQLTLVPLHLGHDPTRSAPAPCLIPEVVIYHDGLLRRPSHRPPQQRGDLPLQYLVAGQPDGVQDAPLFQVLVNLRLGKGSVGRSTGALPSVHSAPGWGPAPPASCPRDGRSRDGAWPPRSP